MHIISVVCSRFFARTLVWDEYKAVISHLYVRVEEEETTCERLKAIKFAMYYPYFVTN